MARRSTYRSGTLLVVALLLAALGATGTATASGPHAAAATGTRAQTAAAAQPPHRYFHEFQANCAVSHTGPDDPIVFPGQPGASHNHTFMGNTTTDADSTAASLDAGGTTCKAPGDKSAYWMPTLFDGDRPILPVGPQTIYYKAGVTDYTSVRPFPKGLRFVVGSPAQSPQDFRDHPGYVEGWECGDSYFNTEFPTDCPDRADVQLNIRLQAPSCWDGSSLDSADHRSHMAYPVVKEGTNDNVCPAGHPVALPMIEFKMAFPVNGDLSAARLASGPSYSFHYDFFNAWDDATLDALVDHCIVGGLQCDARGYDQTHPEEGAALNEDYELPAGVATP
ncbi:MULTISPECIES: DUF1996 domain-containing protein [Streptomyces]|uniref:DUF1996 domain-containing protein n=1 Tax=Streptomyces qinglanensis TaxID=943816 RepID=A0A1E7KA58_9ACTN|nr:MULTISPECIES: DUF1996 domain-containing protein [Streptomyces]MBE9498100.1 DUF1996 domain-containing protein [Streptomyces sp. GKU 257-1]OEV00800.1 hypothetical protein AN217_26725 [Streptomyces qinglanensis]OEV28574.1 hypothetical protein AN220_01205 [Streptomyces nanshensis]